MSRKRKESCSAYAFAGNFLIPKYMKKILLPTIALTFAACATSVPVVNTNSNQNIITQTRTTANAISAQQFGQGAGTITKINQTAGTVELDHGEIKGVMPAMLGMEFKVTNKADLTNLKVGDKVNFTVEGEDKITKIGKAVE